MRYALATWEVRDLLLIPSFMFSESAVIKRKPLSSTARRASVNRAKRQQKGVSPHF
jgi:Dam-replacing family